MSYRQCERLICNYPGNSSRYPLPSCVDTAIRKIFPGEKYTGYMDDADDEDEQDNE